MVGPSKEDLRKRFSYDPLTGVLVWKPIPVRPGNERGCRSWNTKYAGTVAGSIWRGSQNEEGPYLKVTLDGKTYPVHRVIWCLVTGQWPKGQIDHADLDGLNNSWRNLRDASRSQNQANVAAPRTNTSGFKGVSFIQRDQRYRASIRVEGKSHWLGYFDDPAAAHGAYVAAARQHFGEFARAGR